MLALQIPGGQEFACRNGFQQEGVCVCCLEGNQGKQISIALTVTIGQGGRLKRALRAPGARRQHGPVNNFRIDS